MMEVLDLDISLLLWLDGSTPRRLIRKLLYIQSRLVNGTNPMACLFRLKVNCYHAPETVDNANANKAKRVRMC